MRSQNLGWVFWEMKELEPHERQQLHYHVLTDEQTRDLPEPERMYVVFRQHFVRLYFSSRGPEYMVDFSAYM